MINHLGYHLGTSCKRLSPNVIILTERQNQTPLKSKRALYLLLKTTKRNNMTTKNNNFLTSTCSIVDKLLTSHRVCFCKKSAFVCAEVLSWNVISTVVLEKSDVRVIKSHLLFSLPFFFFLKKKWKKGMGMTIEIDMENRQT